MPRAASSRLKMRPGWIGTIRTHPFWVVDDFDVVGITALEPSHLDNEEQRDHAERLAAAMSIEPTL
jgi:hypothetical protein